MTFLTILINFFFFLGLSFIALKTCSQLKIEKSLREVCNPFLAYPVLGIVIISFIASHLIYLKINIQWIGIFFNTLIIFFGVIFSFNLKLLDKSRYLISVIVKDKKNIYVIFLALIIFCYFILSLSPILDADSLAYHAQFPKYLLEKKYFGYDVFNFHDKIAGIVELFYTIPLSIQNEAGLQFVNFFSLILIIGILEKQIAFDNQGLKRIFLISIILSPIFLQLIYSAKPQLIFISLSLLTFAFIDKINPKKINANVLYLIIAILSFNFLGKSSFLISGFLLFLLLFFKIKKNLNLSILSKFVLCVLAFSLPTILNRFLYFEYFEINFLLNSLPMRIAGYENFWYKLRNAQHFYLYDLLLIIPVFVSMTFLLKPNKKYLFSFFLIFLIYFSGLRLSRFFLEPLLWSVYLVFNNNNLFLEKTKTRFFKLFLYSNIFIFSLLVFYTTVYFGKSLLSTSLKHNILRQYSVGYEAIKIINNNIDKNKNIIYPNRQIYYGNNNLIYPEFLSYTNNYSYHVKKMMNKKPKYLVLFNQIASNSFYKKCNTKLILSKTITEQKNRKDFFLKNNFDIIFNLYEINYKELDICLVNDKKNSN